MHAPNERFRLSQFYGGIATCIHFLAEVRLRPGDPGPRAIPIAHRERRQ
jgi:hypothetical protein